MNFKTEICIRDMTKTERNNQTETAGRLFQFHHRNLDGSFEGEIKQTTTKFCITKTLWHRSNRFLGRHRFARAADPYRES